MNIFYAQVIPFSLEDPAFIFNGDHESWYTPFEVPFFIMIELIFLLVVKVNRGCSKNQTSRQLDEKYPFVN
jgi:hypothetical protein